MSQFNSEAILLGVQGVTITVSSGDDGAPMTTVTVTVRSVPVRVRCPGQLRYVCLGGLYPAVWKSCL